MTKIRRFFAIATLVVALAGIALPGASLSATTLASHQISAPVSASQSAKPVALKIYGPCPGNVTLDC